MAACASIAVMPAKAGIHDPIRKRTGCLAREIDPSLRWGDETGNDRFPPHAVPGDFDAYPNTRASDRSSIINRSEEHTSELQSLMRISYAVFCLKKKNEKQ